MPSQNKRVCVFGDSHFACTRAAMTIGAVDATDVTVEFWGNIGKRFRYLTWRNDQIEPLDNFTALRFAKTNVMGRQVLNTTDFDMVLFMGCRIDLHRLIPELLFRRRTAAYRLSAGVELRVIQDFLHRLPPYQFARNFAAQKKARIVVAPVSFNTDGFADNIPARFVAAMDATADDRQAVWNAICEVMKDDGLELVAQPEETIVNGCFTDPAFAVKNYQQRNDRTHKNAYYGALILNEALRPYRANEPVNSAVDVVDSAS
jgi:hypothetical protein